MEANHEKFSKPVYVRLIILTILILSVSLNAQNHEHDGFFLRTQLGTGNGIVEYPGYETFSGIITSLRVQIGLAIKTNLIVYMDISKTGWPNPKLPEYDEGDKISVFDWGFGASYYFMPSNIYIDLSLLILKNSRKNPTAETVEHTGIAFSFAIGKEWWIAKDWGIGGSVFYYSGSAKRDLFSHSVIATKMYGVRLSITYN